MYNFCDYIDVLLRHCGWCDFIVVVTETVWYNFVVIVLFLTTTIFYLLWRLLRLLIQFLLLWLYIPRLLQFLLQWPLFWLQRLVYWFDYCDSYCRDSWVSCDFGWDYWNLWLLRLLRFFFLMWLLKLMWVYCCDYIIALGLTATYTFCDTQVVIRLMSTLRFLLPRHHDLLRCCYCDFDFLYYMFVAIIIVVVTDWDRLSRFLVVVVAENWLMWFLSTTFYTMFVEIIIVVVPEVDRYDFLLWWLLMTEYCGFLETNEATTILFTDQLEGPDDRISWVFFTILGI